MAIDEAGIFEDIPAKDRFTKAVAPPEGMPEMVFAEGMYWLHKAVHVLGGAEIDASTGMLTWSLSAAYQAAYFGARSSMAFLGVVIAEIEKRSIVLDMCRDVRGLRPSEVQELGAFDDTMRLMTIGSLFDHRQTWSLYQRLLRVVTRFCVEPDWVSFLANISVADITKQRHGLHYHLDYWVAEDMHAFLDHTKFCDMGVTGNGKSLYDLEGQNLSLAIAHLTTRSALRMFARIVSSTTRLAPEVELLRTVLGEDRHPVFSATLLAELKASAGATER